MSTQLTTKHRLFVEKMCESDEQEQEGYRLLIEKGMAADFFDALESAGLFEIERCLGPVPSKEPGYVHIPYWHALDYLYECARLSGDNNDTKLGAKVLGVVKRIGSAREIDGSPRHNYHSSRKFAEILGLVPSTLVTTDLIDCIPEWLSDKFDRGLVCEALDKGVVSKFLASEDPDNWEKSLQILRYCTVISIESLSHDDAKTIVDPYWVAKLISNHAVKAGELLGVECVDLFFERLKQIFGDERRRGLNYLFRPAIEDHPQNRAWYQTENTFVEGLRNSLLSWCQKSSIESGQFILKLLHSDLEIAQRIGLHVVTETWPKYEMMFEELLGPDTFQLTNFHEIYRLLDLYFNDMTLSLKNKVIESIESIGPIKSDAAEEGISSIQSRYLAALANKNFPLSDKLIEQSRRTLEYVNQPYPDFLAYMETSWGNGSTPYQPDAIVAYAIQGSLVEKLNEFEEKDRWNGPTVSALVDSLEQAVEQSPNSFIPILQNFLTAKRPYQYGIVAGIKKAWAKVPNENIQEWDIYWICIIDFLYELVGLNSFWDESCSYDSSHTPSRNWIPPAIADLLRSGTSNDKHAYPPRLLSKAFSVLEILLNNLSSEELRSDDAMTSAINSAKGKAIEALFSHALRACRVNRDSKSILHEEVWSEFEPVFTRELKKTESGGYEFSTLAASYLSNIQYLSESWLLKNIESIFPVSRINNLEAALTGLTYGQPTLLGYQLLRDKGIIDFSIKNFNGIRKFKDRFFEYIGWAYLMGQEALDSSRFKYLFDISDFDALSTIARYFWSVSRESLTQEQVALVMDFWRTCVTWTKTLKSDDHKLLGSLSLLSCYLQKLDEDEAFLLHAVAPYASFEHNADRLIEQLERLVDKNPSVVYDVLMVVLANFVPNFDFEDRLKSIIKSMTIHGMKDSAFELADNLRHLRGMKELFAELHLVGRN